MKDDLFPWSKITLREALSLDEMTLTHCLYAFRDPVNWLYIGISHRLVTRLYQHLGIATANGERLMNLEDTVQLLTEDDGKELLDPYDFADYVQDCHSIYIWDGTPIKDLGLFIMNNRPQCLEWEYYYAPIQRLYPNVDTTELDKLLAVEEKKLIIQHKPLFNKQHNKQNKTGQINLILEQNKQGHAMESSTGTRENKVDSMMEFPAFNCLLRERACMYTDAMHLIEAINALYHSTSQFEDRSRDFEEISHEEIQGFISSQANELIKAGTHVLDLDDALEALMEVYGYENVIMAIKWYEEGEAPRYNSP